MAKDELTLEISPTLLEAMGLPRQPRVDYFTLFGLDREHVSVETIDQVLMDRSRDLRKWQNSPKHGQEAIHLLKSLQRVARILKDPVRSQAYRKELERRERGEVASPEEIFTDMVRAALADNLLEAETRKNLNRFAREYQIPQTRAQQIIATVREQMQAESASAPSTEDSGEWQFRLAKEGEEGFLLELHGLEQSGGYSPQAARKMVDNAEQYGLSGERAEQVLRDFQKTHYHKMVKRVSTSGVIQESQARILLAKAKTYGLSHDEAYNIVSELMYSHRTSEDILRAFQATSTFEQSEINSMLGEEAAAPVKKPKTTRGEGIPDWMTNLLMISSVLALIVGAGFAFNYFFQGVDEKAPIRRGAGATGDGAVPNTTGHHVGPATRSGLPGGSRPLIRPQPDPSSGMLAFPPQRENDPERFEMKITEVTCKEFEAFLLATFESPPVGWASRQCPPERARLPVTNLPFDQAQTYCNWLQSEGYGHIRLPTQQQYVRAIRGRTSRGDPREDDYWLRASRQLWRDNGPAPVKTVQWDKIFLPGPEDNTYSGGQMYDLIGNVAEWGRDQKDGRRVLFGGDYTQHNPDFDPLQVRWVDPDTVQPTIGFRYVREIE